MRPPLSDCKLDADVVGADRPRVGQPVTRQREDRRDMAGAERAGLFQRVEQAERRALGGERAVDRQAFLVLQPEHVGRRALLEKGPQLAELRPLDRDAGRHAHGRRP